MYKPVVWTVWASLCKNSLTASGIRKIFRVDGMAWRKMPIKTADIFSAARIFSWCDFSVGVKASNLMVCPVIRLGPV